MQPGIYHEMDFEDYLAISAMSASLIKAGWLAEDGCVSPKHMHWAEQHPIVPTTKMKVGTVVGMALSEPRHMLERLVVYPGPTRRGKKFDAFAAQHPGKLILLQSEHDEAMAMHRALVQSKLVKPILAKLPIHEVVHVWHDDELGCLCKTRLDMECPDSQEVYELKSTHSLGHVAWRSVVLNKNYLLQLAFQRRAVRNTRNFSPAMHIVAVSGDKDAYDVAVQPWHDDDLDIAEDRCVQVVRAYHECQKAGYYYGRQREPKAMELPPWWYDGEGEQATHSLKIS